MELKRSQVAVDENDKFDSKVKKNADQKMKCKKVALLVGYVGFGYHGVQIQKNTLVKTIEADLFNALLLSGAVKKENAGEAKKMSFQRCSRTDKDVSAVRQVFSLKMRHDSDVIKDINKYLPENIKAFGFVRATKKFNSKKSCDSRTYEYFIPTYAFAPTMEETTINYRITENITKRLNELMLTIKGTHNFYNFTSKRSNGDKGLNRYIIDFKINKIFIYKNVEFISFLIDGQSFMFHQIRKTIGYLFAVIRSLISPEQQTQIFQNKRIDIPIAPGLGLILENVHFAQYNKRFVDDSSHCKIEWTQYEEEIQSFKNDKIVKHILETETAQSSTLEWIQKCMEFQITESTEESDSKDNE